jgi:hypothetical protein
MEWRLSYENMKKQKISQQAEGRSKAAGDLVQMGGARCLYVRSANHSVQDPSSMEKTVTSLLVICGEEVLERIDRHLGHLCNGIGKLVYMRLEMVGSSGSGMWRKSSGWAGRF